MPHPRTRIRKEVRAGLVFPISRIRRHLQRGQYAKKIGVGSAIYLAAVMEYLVAEVLELAGNLTSQIRFDGRKTKSIHPHHINLAIK
jgi:histone H2A